MGKIITILLAGILLTGCGSVKLRTETVEVFKPILYCPAPNYDELNRPDQLPIDDITPTSTDGEVAVRYKATVKLLQGYIDRLELLLKQYDSTHEAYEQLRNQYLEQTKKDGFDVEKK